MRFSVSKHSPVSVVGRGGFWYARFWDYERKTWAVTRSTSVPVSRPKDQAEKIALQMLRAGILGQVVAASGGAAPFLSHLRDFWGKDGYPADCAARGAPLAAAYVAGMESGIRLHAAPYPRFKKLRLDEITTGDIEAWRTWARRERGLSVDRSNKTLQAIKVCLAEAARRGVIPSDPARSVKPASLPRDERRAREKGALSLAEVSRYFALTGGDPRRRAAFILAVESGLRRGEVRGIRWGEVIEAMETGELEVKHNYVNGDGAKGCKCGSDGKTFFTEVEREALKALWAVSRHTGTEDFVFESIKRPGQPMAGSWFEESFYRELETIGISREEAERRRLTLHSLRHTAITHWQLMGATLSEAAAGARQKSVKTTQRYSEEAKILDFKEWGRKLEARRLAS